MSLAKYGSTIPEFVRRFREDAGLTQKELGEAMGLGYQYVSNVERGDHLNPVSFCVRLRPHLESRRQKYLDDLIEQAMQESLAERMDGSDIRRNTKPKRKIR